MPAELSYGPLTLSWVVNGRNGRTMADSDARRGSAEVGGEENPALARDLAVGLVNLVHPHGTVDAGSTIDGYLAAIQYCTKSLPASKNPGGAAGLSRARLAECLMGAGHLNEGRARRMLHAFDAETGALSESVRALVDGRHYNPKQRKASLPPYSEAEWERLAAVCRRVIASADRGLREGLALAESGRDPLAHGFTSANACWWVREHGPRPAEFFAGALGLPLHRYHITVAYGDPIGRAVSLLIPRTGTVIAYQTLFGIYTGIVPDGIAGLGLGDWEWAGDGAALLSYVKGRTSREGLVLGERPMRLLERWLEYSTLARALAPEDLRGRLWIRYLPSGTAAGWSADTVGSNTAHGWCSRMGLVGGDGEPLRLHRHRIRTTFEALRDRTAWTGSTRTVIDPNHTARVEADSYLGNPTEAQRGKLEEIIAEAQGEILRRAAPPQVLEADEVADLAERFPSLVAQAKLDAAAIKDLVGGARDVFAAGCADPLSGQFGQQGQPCPARPWVCLLCPLAIFAPRHLPNLLRLRAYFTRAFLAMTAPRFMPVFGYYAQRVDQILEVFKAKVPKLHATALSQVAGRDDELPLLPEELTA